MTRISSRLALLLVLTALTLLQVPSGAGRQALQFSPRAPRQGDALFVRLDVPDAENPRVSWLNKTYPLYRDGSSWSGAVPIRPETRPGGRTLLVRYTLAGRSEIAQRGVEIAKVAYPVQHLRMAKGTARLYNYPGVEKENRLVGGAIRVQSPDRLWSGDFLIPSPGRMSTAFGERRLRNGRDVGRHRGMDIAAKTGVPVLATADGKVVLSGTYRKHGGTVVLDHGQGVTSLYLHLSARHVRTGDTVQRGERVGSVGATGVATGPHLHWSVYVHGTPVEPLMFCRMSKRGIVP